MFAKISEFLPSLIIMDIDLDGEDGRHICREIKQNSETRNIPVILCSGNHDLLTTYSTFLADDFIEKPFKINSIINKIERLIYTYS